MIRKRELSKKQRLNFEVRGQPIKGGGWNHGKVAGYLRNRGSNLKYIFKEKKE